MQKDPKVGHIHTRSFSAPQTKMIQTRKIGYFINVHSRFSKTAASSTLSFSAAKPLIYCGLMKLYKD
jgi:hypothetical protein